MKHLRDVARVLAFILAYGLLCIPAVLVYVGFNDGPLWLIPFGIVFAVLILWFLKNLGFAPR